MILGTYANLIAIDEKHSGLTVDDQIKITQNHNNHNSNNKLKNISENIETKEKIISKTIKDNYHKNLTKFNEGKKSIVQEKTKEDKLLLQSLPNVNDELIQKDVKQNVAEIKEKSKTLNDIPTNSIPEKLKFPKNIEQIIDKIEKNGDKNKNENDVLIKQQKGNVKNDNKKPIEIDKEAIKKDEEITAEEEEQIKKKSKDNQNDSNAAAAANELVKTKEILEKTVDEIREHLAKQNVETQNLVVEKLGDIVLKVKQIEKQVYEDQNQKEKGNEEDNNKQEQVITKDSKDAIIDQKFNENSIKHELNKSIKSPPNTTDAILKTDKNIENIVPVIEKTKNEQADIQQQENKQQQINTNQNKKNELNENEKITNTIQQPQDHQLLLPLPLLINSTIIKQNFPNNSEKVNDNQKMSENLKIKPSTNKSTENIAAAVINHEEENNIESIRRDILEVVTKNDENDNVGVVIVPSSLKPISYKNNRKNNHENEIEINNRLREKRESLKDTSTCINWDVIKLDCLDMMVKKSNHDNIEKTENLNLINDQPSSLIIQSIGRDLKSLREKTGN